MALRMQSDPGLYGTANSYQRCRHCGRLMRLAQLIQEVTGALGLHVERDLYWRPAEGMTLNDYWNKALTARRIVA